jgi:hypothetical protein
MSCSVWGRKLSVYYIQLHESHEMQRERSALSLSRYTIWGANIEGRPVELYEQVIRYLFKYMMKDEPNSQPFSAICKAVVESAEDDEPVCKTFQQILMKTVVQHDFSKQQCFHIVNGLDLVEMKRKTVKVNVMATQSSHSNRH